ncbi:hypothetical protein GCM10009623_03840 [Nocardioides aestuarii]|uniref:DUF2142 domain-containing protein n=1 Tax=Nocardioides aestuarii TaxID=252231 RepID=A0ABW4TH34_9ACTN
MRPVRFAAVVAVGYLLMQTLWILTVPPFRGVDEFDHAFRAAGAATGQWRLTEPAADGRGMEVVVPADLVAAASAQCDWLPYPGPDNCFPIDEVGEDQVVIATSAALYNPVWYAVVGQAGRPFEGAGSLYAMRIFTSLVCAVGVGLAAWALALRRPGRWTRFGFVAALTPVWIYSTVVPGPNGPEMTAGLILWMSLLAVFDPEVPPRHERWLLCLAGGAACVLATLRLLGPMWLGVVVLAVVALVGYRQVFAVVRRRARWWAAVSGVVVVAVVAGSWWSLDQGMTGTSLDVQGKGPMPEFEVGTKPFAWTLGMVAAFPLRRETAHPAVYMCVSLALGFILVAAVIRARGRHRVVLGAMLLLVVALPVVLTAATMDTQGVIWQGRYQLAWAVGIPVVAGAVLDHTGFLRGERDKPVVLLVVLLAIAHGMSVWGVSLGETRRPVSADDPSWVSLPPVLLGVLFFLLALVWATWLCTRPWADEGEAVGKPSAVETARG